MKRSTQELLKSYPIPSQQVNEWVQNPPIWYAVPEPNRGNWSRTDIEAGIAIAVDILSHEGAPLIDVITHTLRLIWLYRDMQVPKKECLEQDLNDGMVAVLFQLINNIIDAGFRVRQSMFGTDPSTAIEELGITIEIYTAP